MAILMVSGPLLRGQGDGDELPGDGREQLEAFKVAFFTRQLSLTSGEAQRFWPVYNEFAEKSEQLQRRERRLQARMKAAYDGDDESELERLSDEYIDIQRLQYELRAEYHEEFKKVLPIRKVVKLYKAENEFKRELLLEIRRRRQERMRNE